MTYSEPASALFTESSPQDGPAPISAWQAFASDWVAHARGSSGKSFASSSAFGPGGSSWKTCPVSCHLSAPALGGAHVEPDAPQLTLFGEDPADEPYDEEPPTGPDDAWSFTAAGWVPSSGHWANSGMASPTECWTLSTSESPSVGVASSLSDILETGPVPPKYSLSPKSATGILRRAARRGRVLRGELERELTALAAKWSAPSD
jgi:hypothetical protein